MLVNICISFYEYSFRIKYNIKFLRFLFYFNNFTVVLEISDLNLYFLNYNLSKKFKLDLKDLKSKFIAINY